MRPARQTESTRSAMYPAGASALVSRYSIIPTRCRQTSSTSPPPLLIFPTLSNAVEPVVRGEDW